jgi:uncharacterized protein (TIGR02646 family)
MRKLNRADINEPACLANYQHGHHQWDDVTGENKAQIRQQLQHMQGRRCAYCEGSLDALGSHIEHFRRKAPGHFPQLTFAWCNLFWSCDQPDSCGHYKDHGAGTYDVNDLIDPCVDNPDTFFRFRTDGTVNVRSDLGAADKHKAEETLRVFNLNPHWGRLRNMRKAAVSAYVSFVDGCVGFSAGELHDFFRDELAAAATLPFFTAIRHVLTEV